MTNNTRTTESLIASLARNLSAVEPLPSVGRRMTLPLGIAAAALMVSVGVFGVRHNWHSAIVSPGVAMQQAALCAVAVFALWAAVASSVPGVSSRRDDRLAIAGWAAWPLIALTGLWMRGGAVASIAREPLHPYCAAVIAGVSVVAAVAFRRATSAGLVLSGRRSAMLCALGASAAGAFAAQWICPIARESHIIAAHVLPAMAMTMIAAAIPVRLSRGAVTAAMTLVLALGFSHNAIAEPTTTSTPTPAQEPAVLGGFSPARVTTGYVASEDFLRFLDGANSPTTAGALVGRGTAAVLATVLVGGLALNLTPCVLPMIPINLAIIGAGAGGASRRRRWWLGSTYGAGMALAYGALGAIIVLTAGTFGTINASPWFNAAIAMLFVVLGLAMFDVVSIDFSRWSRAGSASAERRGTFGLAFFMGGIAAILAGACVAPVVIQVMVLSAQLFSSGHKSALALPLVLGAGMALPWPFAGAGLAALPKPGRWMVHVKHAMGVFIFISAAYYGYEAQQLFAAAPQSSAAHQPPAAALTPDGAYTSLTDGLQEARRTGKPVFIDMWASWCKNCVTMDRTTFQDPKVVTALDRFVRVKLQSEDTEAGDVKVLLDRFDSFGLPTYAVLVPEPPNR